MQRAMAFGSFSSRQAVEQCSQAVAHALQASMQLANGWWLMGRPFDVVDVVGLVNDQLPLPCKAEAQI